MFSIPDLAVAGAVALLLFGPDKLPRVARRAGQIVRDVQNTSQSFIREMERAADVSETADIETRHGAAIPTFTETPPAAPLYHETPVPAPFYDEETSAAVAHEATPAVAHGAAALGGHEPAPVVGHDLPAPAVSETIVHTSSGSAAGEPAP